MHDFGALHSSFPATSTSSEPAQDNLTGSFLPRLAQPIHSLLPEINTRIMNGSFCATQSMTDPLLYIIL